ncbi:hypothetical protein C2G38_143873 [Gigaspora rosea]|uniref:Ion transport domain-containing protein n=1 Tax=Gigaspora rosea TaxID=44941 RepID=A0A397VWH3_9GLOM|nr:hypothetical protein C2G38_143873 [Gigaspora rosea]
MLQESIVDIDEENGETKELYLAISPNGDFVVEFVLLQVLLPDESKLWRFKFRMYNVENPNKNDYLDLEDKERFAYRKLSDIATSKLLKFTKEQSDLITSENNPCWSVAVSDKLYSFKKSYKSTVRLLAISCISKHDMTPKDHIYPEDSKMPGFVNIFSINEDYSIGEMFKLNEYGGIVKLFSKNGNNKKMNKNSQYINIKSTNEDNQNIDIKETNEINQNIDKFFLVILNACGIHKYQFGQLNNNNVGYIQNLRYPKRIYNTINFNIIFDHSCMEYIQKCLNKHYFLVDTTIENAQYMELYDLKTDQLVNTFKRPNLNSLNFIANIPANFAISNNNKLLAYNSGNQVKLYLIECGLEIASIEIKTDEMSFHGYFIHFFNDDERLLIYRSKNKCTIWDIFGSIQKSNKLEIQLEHELEIVDFLKFDYYQLERSNSFIIIVKNKEKEGKEFSEDKRIYDDLTLDYLKRKGDKQDFQILSLDETFEERTHIKHKLFIFDLDNKKSELDEYYYIFEPWLFASLGEKETPRYSVYLDKKKEILLLIGSHTIQVWYDQSKERTLEFISVIDKNERKSEIKKIEYAIRKFKLSIQSKDSQSVIEIGNNDDITYTAKEACHTLKYLNQIYHPSNRFNRVYSRSLTNEKCHLKFQEIVKQTRNIILRFIRLYPIAWRLIDFRFDLLSILIEAREYQLIKYILFGEVISLRSLHMPQYTSWGGETINTIFKAFADDDPIYLGYLLEYYSNKAIENIGWMITVGEIIPMLYNKNNKNYGIYKFYIQLLLYKPCFGRKKLDIQFFEFLEIPPTISNCSETFIPITQLIPQESILKVEEISPDKIPYTQMVPLIDFATNNELSLELRGNKFMNFLKSIFCPGEFVPPDEYHVPFLSLLYEVENNYDDHFYYNPSMEAIMNFMWYSSKSHWPPILYAFIIYFLSYTIISWMYIAHIQVVGIFQHILVLVTIIIFFYLTYYHIIIEYNLLCLKRWRYYTNLFNWVDIFAFLLPFLISIYVLTNYYSFENGFKYAESSLHMAFIICLSILGIWYELVLLLRVIPGFAHYINVLYNIIVNIRLFLLFFAMTIIAMGHALFIFLGYASYIGLNQSSATYEVSNGSKVVYTMTGEPENLFLNPFSAIIAVYNWESLSLDNWGFCPLIILSIIGNIVFVIILQNVIISFMSAAFESADKDGKRAVLYYQSSLLYEYMLLKNSAFISGQTDLDSKLKAKLKMKYICFYDDESVTAAWSYQCEKLKSIPIYSAAVRQRQMQMDDFPSLGECEFIWTSKINDDDT